MGGWIACKSKLGVGSCFVFIIELNKLTSQQIGNEDNQLVVRCKNPNLKMMHEPIRLVRDIEVKSSRRKPTSVRSQQAGGNDLLQAISEESKSGSDQSCYESLASVESIGYEGPH